VGGLDLLGRGLMAHGRFVGRTRKVVERQQ
jgi:hypothetical protein